MALKEKEICSTFYTRVKMLQAHGQLPGDWIVFHIANEQHNNLLYTMQLKRMGLLAGVPDYCILFTKGRVAFLEFKRNVKCKLTPSQEVFRQRCLALEIPCGLVWTVEDGLEFVLSLLHQ
jgi:hypothetical protein